MRLPPPGDQHILPSHERRIISQMSVFPGATNTTINHGNFTAVSTTVNNTGPQNGIVGLLHSHSATAGLLDAKERFDAPKCDKGTRTSMILGMKKFVQDGGPASPPALYWLHGPAGAGKSALAQSLSLELKDEGDHAASFFFSRTSPGRNNGDQLIATLAYQLATNFPALRPFMSQVVKENPAILTAANVVQMQSLIVDPINEWQKKYRRSVRRWAHKIFHSNKKLHPRLILVDGLDECSNPNVQKDLILCIAVAVHRLSVPFRFVIASRPESHILATFELDPAFQGPSGVTVTKINLGDDEDADEHITTFLLKEFAEIRRVHPIRGSLPEQWPSPDQVEQLVSKSSKGFIYPATVIRYIKTHHNRPDECLERIMGLSAIPTFDKPYEPLDLLYRYIFESVPEANKTSVHSIFHFLVLPSTWDGVTNCRIIERHFGYKPSHVQHVLHDLLCLLALTDDGCIKVLHASLPDFLLNQSRSGPLYIDASNVHTAITASFLLDITHSDELPKFQVNFLREHMMQANLSNPLISNRILQVDLVSWYTKLCSRWLNIPPGNSEPQQAGSQSPQVLPSRSDMKFPEYRQPDAGKSLPEADIKGIAFVVAYLLVMDGPQQYIETQITGIKGYARQICPCVASVHLVYEDLIPAMIPLFRKWNSSVYDEYINHIFALEVAPWLYQIREDIFELCFLMMVPFCGVDVNRMHRQHGREEIMNAMQSITWEDIVRNLGDMDNVTQQIMTFLLKEFAEVRRTHPLRDFIPKQWPRPDQIERLVSKSSEGFVYPATVIRYIKMPQNRPDECLERILGLSEIPTSGKPYEPLDGLYHHIFESVPEINTSSVHAIFHFLVLPSTWDGVTSTNTIERHFDYKPGHVQHVLHDLLCLVAFTDDGRIKVLDTSLPDFLLNQSRSGPLCIDVGDAHTAVTASCLLDITHSDEPPKFQVNFLREHMMQANLSNPLISNRILQVDLVSWYTKLCGRWLNIPPGNSRPQQAGSQSPEVWPSRSDMKFPEYQRPEQSLPEADIKGIAFMDGPKQYIEAQIAGIKGYARQICPFVTSIHLVYEELIPVMWNSSVYDEYTNHIFAFEVAASLYQIHEDIFELCFLMMVPFCGVDVNRMPRQQGMEKTIKSTNPVTWADIVRNLGHDDDVDQRIMTFLLKEFAEVRKIHPLRGFLPELWPRLDQVEQLVSKSSKGFIYPATVIRYIKMPQNRPDECLERILGLSEIPTSDKPYEPLDGLYRHIFESVPEINKSSVHAIFHFLVLPSTWDGVTSTNTIERHFDYEPGHVQHVLHDLLCLVRFTDDGCIKVLHASLPNFLLDQSRSGPLYIDIADAHATIVAGHLLDVIHTTELLDHDKFVAPLKHLIQLKLSNAPMCHEILAMDVILWYKKCCFEQLEAPDARSPHGRSWKQYYDYHEPLRRIKLLYLLDLGSPEDDVPRAIVKTLIPPSVPIVHALTFMVAYLLVVVVKTPFFQKWTSTEYINHIFAFEVSDSQHQIRQDIFELHFLMMIPFCQANKALALRLIETKEENESTKPINWADVVGGRAKND
ncbi:hypothetical protein D9619_007703 [Psilocybe cf. subviscida]|uniref:Nephrocystin 3-like N-terminal domain-containing protein n=1 Tax=Psilocybe cf. subviscida TaxID=2480587 RepID=A0A8H5ESD3_9AGAR|nr:hypothetical protein D9619_007703 [Psilocybe cf. subviscida]